MRVNITKFDHFGRGIGKINEKVIFVNKALPEEIVNVEIINDKKNYFEGYIKEIIQESNTRVKPVCPYYDICGGCDFLHTNYEVEKEFKINKAKELLNRCDKFYETNNLNYRNKVTLHFKDNKLGFYEEKSKTIVNIAYCYLLNDNINKVISDLNKMNLSKYKFETIVIKTNQNKTLLAVDNLIDEDFINNFPYIDTIISKDKIIKGNGFLEEIIDNNVFKITSQAFFQVNIEGLKNINIIIQEFLINKKINRALDLYSGISLWGILISDKVDEVISIEINKEASHNAKENIKKNNIDNIKIINGDVKDYINQFNNIDLVIIDPPRSGLDKKTRGYLKGINSQYIIYISCDMATLKRDLEELKEKYNINEINLVDMFRGTYHCESIVILERKTQ